MKWISFRGWSVINSPLSKSQSFLLTHEQIFPLIWFHFGCCLHDILSPAMKFHFCQNDRNEIAPATSFSSGCIMQTLIRDWRDTKMKIFHFARNEISCKHPLKKNTDVILNKLCNIFSKNIFQIKENREKILDKKLAKLLLLLVSGQLPPRKIAPRLGLWGNIPRGQLS